MTDSETMVIQLQQEKDSLGSEFTHASRLIAQEIDRIQTGGDKPKYTEIHQDKPMKMTEKIRIPVGQFPKFNFVGRLLGPKGQSLKKLQEDTGTKMSILGKGSMRDRSKEEQMRREGGKYAHLNEDLHVLIEVFALASDCHQRISHAITELRRFFEPQDPNDEIRQQQMQDMVFMPPGQNGESAPGRGRGRGRGVGPPPSRGRGGAPLLAGPPARGGMPPPPGPPPSRGGPAVGRGAPRGRGAPPMSMGSMGRGGPAPPARAPPVQDMGYEQEYSYQEEPTAYENYASYDDQSGYGGSAGYDKTPSYSASAPVDQQQYYDYGHGNSREESYNDYGASDQGWGSQQTSSYGKVAPPMRGGIAQARSHPYGAGPPGRGARY